MRLIRGSKTPNIEAPSADEVEMSEIQKDIAYETKAGRKVLQELSHVETTPKLTLANVWKATDTPAFLTCIALSLIYAALSLAQFASVSQIAFMVADLGRADLGSWIAVSATISTGAITIATSGYTDYIGRRDAIVLGAVLGVGGGCLSGFAPTTKIIIAGQVLTGIAIGLCINSNSVLAEVVPSFTRPFWTAIMHVSGTIAQAFGPIYCGAFVKADKAGWRWMFWINAMAFGIAGIFILFLYRPKSRLKALGISQRELLRSFDYGGLLLLVGGLTTLLLGLSWGGDLRYGWHDAHAIAPLVIGCVTFLIGVPLWEYYVAEMPLLPQALFRERTFVVVNIAGFVEGFLTLTALNYFPQIIIKFWNQDPVVVGLYRLPLSATISIGVVVSGILLQVTGRYKWQFIISSFVMAIGSALWAVLEPDMSVGVPLVISIILGAGLGATIQLSFVVAQYCIPQDKLGMGTGILNTSRAVGSSTGVAVFNSVLNSRLNSRLPGAVTAAALKAGAPRSELPQILQACFLGSKALLMKATHGSAAIVGPVWTAYLNTSADAYRVMFLSTIPFGVLACVSVFFLREVTHFMSDETVFGLGHESPTEDKDASTA